MLCFFFVDLKIEACPDKQGRDGWRGREGREKYIDRNVHRVKEGQRRVVRAQRPVVILPSLSPKVIDGGVRLFY